MYSEEQMTTLLGVLEDKVLWVLNKDEKGFTQIQDEVQGALRCVFGNLPFYLGKDIRPELRKLLGDKYVE